MQACAEQGGRHPQKLRHGLLIIMFHLVKLSKLGLLGSQTIGVIGFRVIGFRVPDRID